VLADGKACLFEPDLHDGPIVWTRVRDHHMVDRSRDVEEETLERSSFTGPRGSETVTNLEIEQASLECWWSVHGLSVGAARRSG
jgi:hypothetical protein